MSESKARSSACRTALVLSLAVAGGFEWSCATSTAPQPGTPPFYWAGAKEAFTAGDYDKAIESLDHIVSSDNEYTARAQPMLLIITSGLARGYMDVADTLETGVKAKHVDPGSYRKYISNYRSTAARLSLHFAETFLSFQKGKDDPVPLAFSFPNGSPSVDPELARAAKGFALDSVQMDASLKHTLDRMVLLETCRAAGAPDDAAKGLALFKSGSPQVPRATFLGAMANSLYEQSQLYTPNKLDDPSKQKVLTNLASEALKGVPESKQTKDLMAKIEKSSAKKK
jgi:hypothetical protein